MRRYGGHNSDELKASAFLRGANVAARSVWFSITVIKGELIPSVSNGNCQRPVVETFAGGAELLRRCALGTVPRGPCSGPSASVFRIRPAAITALIIISSGPCTPALLPNDGRGIQHLELMLRDGERDDRLALVGLVAWS